jgi:hypothetical protein
MTWYFFWKLISNSNIKLKKILNEFSKPERHKTAQEKHLCNYALVIISPKREIIKQFNLHLIVKEKKYWKINLIRKEKLCIMKVTKDLWN